jgi:hypothetical protein
MDVELIVALLGPRAPQIPFQRQPEWLRDSEWARWEYLTDLAHAAALEAASEAAKDAHERWFEAANHRCFTGEDLGVDALNRAYGAIYNTVRRDTHRELLAGLECPDGCTPTADVIYRDYGVPTERGLSAGAGARTFNRAREVAEQIFQAFGCIPAFLTPAQCQMIA